jgi:hypothetical protein
MSNFTQQDKPLLAYSWLPRAGVIDANYARITLESYYHCGDGDPSTPFLTPFEREVNACDFPIEHVEKAVVWRLQQPSSTTAALFVNKFKLNASQLNDLLLNMTGSSTPSEVDQAACRWLNENTDAWKDWLPDFELHDHLLYQWDVWLIVSVLVSLVGGVIVFLYQEYSALKGAEAEADADHVSYSSWPADKNTSCMLSCLICMWVAAYSRLLDSEKWDPVFEYLSNSFRCMVNAKKGKAKDGRENKDRWSFRVRLVSFALGQLFVGASTGFFEGLIYSIWLTYGLNRLSLEVTISCAVMMITLKLVKWCLSSLPSGEQVVRRQLQIRLRIHFKKLYCTDTVENGTQNKWDSELDQNEAKLYCVQQFENAINETAKELASDCYRAAWTVFSELLGFFSAITFLCYYTFEEGIPQYVSYLLIVAFTCAPAWLCIVMAVSPLLRVSSAKYGSKKGRLLIMWTLRYKTAYFGVLWTCVYFLWALGPILINPLKNNLGTGTNFVPLPDLLAVSKRNTACFVHICLAAPN